MTESIELIRKFQDHAPVDVVGLANELGMKVWTSMKLSDDISGKLFKDEALGGTSSYAIVVNGTHPEVRRRFTIAHEIAHFLLHRNDVGDGISDNQFYRSNLSNKQETEANKLAAEILMPHSLIKKLTTDNQLGNKDTKPLANKLNVSEVAMKIRLGINF